MFGLGYPELFVIGLVALIVIGPRRLPEVLRQAGRWSTRLRRMANEFRRELELAADEEELRAGGSKPPGSGSDARIEPVKPFERPRETSETDAP